MVRLRSGGARRAGDPETGAGSAGRNNGSSESVDTLPRYTPGGQEGCVAPPEQSDEHDGVGGEGAKPPPYTLDAGGAVTEASNGGGRGEGHGGFPASPAPAHLQSS